MLLAGAATAGRAEGKGPDVALTPEERQWIAAHPVIRVGYDVRQAPFAFEDHDGRIVGIDADYLQLISERTGLHFASVVRDDWLVAMRSTQNPPADLVTDLGDVPGRESFLTYTKPYCFSATVMITRDDAPPAVTALDLQNRRVAITRGYQQQLLDLRRAAPECVVVEYPDDAATLRAVAGGQCFAGIDDVITASYLVRRHGLTNLRLGSSLAGSDFNLFGVRPDWPLLVQILNKGIDRINARERNAIATRWVGVDLEAGQRWARAFRYAAAGAGVIAVILLLVFYHNRRLQRELAERRRIQRALEEAHSHLALVSAEKTRILNIVAHDLRGPLTSIMLNAELLDLPPLPGAAPDEKLPAQIRASAKSMARLIEELLSAHQIEAGRRAVKFTQVDLAAITRAAAREWTASARAKRIELEVLGPESVPLESDPDALGKIAGNLLSNAVKYSPHGTLVTATLEVAGERIRLSLCDQGSGVKPEERDKIFTQFGRGSAQPTSGESSHGLGLWIIRLLVTDLGGRVWCEGREGPGACFIVELPVRSRTRP